MRQAVHIFVKDARHFWPEILVSLAVTGAFAWIEPYSWRHDSGWEPGRLRMLRQLAGVVMVLMPVSWWVLITRLAHAEGLVGDRQWWVTKPYEWTQLLGAKLLFLGAFVLVPFLVAQCVVMQAAGFYWYEHLPGLAFLLAMVSGFLVGPLLALAAVTSGFGKTTLTLLMALVGFILIGVLSAVVDTGSISSYGDEAGGIAAFLLILCCCVGAIVLQYGRRMSWMSRLLLASIFVPLAGAMLLGSTPQLIAMAYPVSRASFHIAMDPNPGRTFSSDAGGGKVGVTLPLVVTGVDGGSIARVDGIRATLETQGGKRWTSRWEPIYGQLYAPGGVRARLPLQVDRKFFEAVGSQPVKVDLTLAVTALKAEEDRVAQMTTGEMAVPGVGICWANGAWRPDTYSPDGIQCRTAMREPPLTYVNVRWAEVMCPADSKDEVPGAGIVGQMMGDASNDPAQFGLTSVWQSSAWLQNYTVDTEKDGKVVRHTPLLCPGTPIHFTHYLVTGRMQYEVRLENFKMPEMQGLEGRTIGLRF
jgi:hypothetical protein